VKSHSNWTEINAVHIFNARFIYVTKFLVSFFQGKYIFYEPNWAYEGLLGRYPHINSFKLIFDRHLHLCLAVKSAQSLKFSTNSTTALCRSEILYWTPILNFNPIKMYQPPKIVLPISVATYSVFCRHLLIKSYTKTVHFVSKSFQSYFKCPLNWSSSIHIIIEWKISQWIYTSP
jgi:hypothetical protein